MGKNHHDYKQNFYTSSSDTLYGTSLQSHTYTQLEIYIFDQPMYTQSHAQKVGDHFPQMGYDNPIKHEIMLKQSKHSQLQSILLDAD